MIKAHKAGDWTITPDGTAVVGGVELEPDEFDFRVVSAGEGAVATLKGAAGLVVLDTAVTPELELEGRARDLIRQIQQARRDAGLDVSDRIALDVRGAADVVAAFDAHRALSTRRRWRRRRPRRSIPSSLPAPRPCRSRGHSGRHRAQVSRPDRRRE